MRRQAFSSSSLQFHILNYLALMAKYDLLNYRKIVDFAGKLPQQDRACFLNLILSHRYHTRSSVQKSPPVGSRDAYRASTQSPLRLPSLHQSYQVREVLPQALWYCPQHLHGTDTCSMPQYRPRLSRFFPSENFSYWKNWNLPCYGALLNPLPQYCLDT